jgi:hypothetical protein
MHTSQFQGLFVHTLNLLVRMHRTCQTPQRTLRNDGQEAMGEKAVALRLIYASIHRIAVTHVNIHEALRRVMN